MKFHFLLIWSHHHFSTNSTWCPINRPRMPLVWKWKRTASLGFHEVLRTLCVSLCEFRSSNVQMTLSIWSFSVVNFQFSQIHPILSFFWYINDIAATEWAVYDKHIGEMPPFLWMTVNSPVIRKTILRANFWPTICRQSSSFNWYNLPCLF